MTGSAPAAAPGLTPPDGSSLQPGFHPGPAVVLTAIGWCCVVVGGLVAAVTGPLDLDRGSWLAAYLVLVGGVTQCAMGHARSRSVASEQSRRQGWAQIVGWNLGSALVIGGSLVGEPLVVDLGSVLLVIALALALHATRFAAGARRPLPLFADWAYRILLLVLAVSIPVGMVLSHLRHA